MRKLDERAMEIYLKEKKTLKEAYEQAKEEEQYEKLKDELKGMKFPIELF